MPDQVRKSIGLRVKCKRHFGTYSYDDRRNQRPQHTGIELPALSINQKNGSQENHGNDIFTNPLEKSQTNSHDETSRKYAPIENGYHGKGKHQSVNKNYEVESQLSAEEERC